MIGFQFYAAGTFQFLIILVQGAILFAKGANRSEHFARRLTLDLLGLFLISLPLTLGYWRIDQGCRERCAQQLGHCGALSHAVSVDRRDAEAMLSAILPILFDGGCDRLRLPTHFYEIRLIVNVLLKLDVALYAAVGWPAGFWVSFFSGACHG